MLSRPSSERPAVETFLRETSFETIGGGDDAVKTIGGGDDAVNTFPKNDENIGGGDDAVNTFFSNTGLDLP